jgi:hypothetical protein
MGAQMIHERLAGKFYTDPVQANSRQNAFLQVVGELGVEVEEFIPVLMPADDEVISFMWHRAVLLQAEGAYGVFCLYDYGGWRFFGRIQRRD